MSPASLGSAFAHSTYACSLATIRCSFWAWCRTTVVVWLLNRLSQNTPGTANTDWCALMPGKTNDS